MAKDYDRQLLQCKVFLEKLGVDKIPHSKRTLDVHLVGVWKMLTKCKVAKSWRLAGLFHSIYSTVYFKKGPLELTEENRAVVRSIIGDTAEELVYEFCVAAHPRLQTILGMEDVDKRRALAAIHVVNALEQGRNVVITPELRECLEFRVLKLMRESIPSNEIVVCDDLCDDMPLIKGVYDELNTHRWKYGWHSTKKKPNVFFNCRLMGKRGKDVTMEEVETFHKENPQCGKLITSMVKSLGGKFRVSRVYANLYTYGSAGAMHEDDGLNTLLYFVTPDWKPDYNGELLIYSKDGAEIERAITYKPGRFVVFDSRRPHQGREIDRFCTLPRIILTAKGVLL